MNKQIFGNLEHIFHKNSWRIATVFIVIAILGGLTFFIPRPAARTIQITGEGKSTVVPEKYTYSATIEVKKLTADDARTAVSAQVSQITKILSEKGISAENVKSETINVTPEYQSTVAGMKVSDYLGQESISISAADLAKLLEISSVLTGNDATNLVGPTPFFASEKVASARSDAEKKAMENAKTRAASLAHENGDKLAEVLQTSEANLAMPLPASAALSAGGQSVTPSPTALTENEVTAYITVTYAVK
ncbi:MAG: SIMPL domain-containing protein [Candidatus Berkelbacteria bacterium]